MFNKSLNQQYDKINVSSKKHKGISVKLHELHEPWLTRQERPVSTFSFQKSEKEKGEQQSTAKIHSQLQQGPSDPIPSTNNRRKQKTSRTHKRGGDFRDNNTDFRLKSPFYPFGYFSV